MLITMLYIITLLMVDFMSDDKEEVKRRLEGLFHVKSIEEQINRNLSEVKYKIGVISGKGGVGKSTVTANMAVALALKGSKVAIFDSDFHGPSIPKMLGVMDRELMVTKDRKIIPIEGPLGIKVISIAYFLPDKTEAVIWRGPLKKKFFDDLAMYTQWGKLDYLLFDLPPGTGDEALNLAQSIRDVTGVIAVTQPTEVSALAVAKSLNFAKKVNIRVLGVIENMSYFICGDGKKYKIFHGEGGELLSKEFEIPILGKIPIDPRVAEYGDSGYSLLMEDPDSEFSKVFF
ncbi:TPA: ATP-binding protein, partial [Candidatus Geothermarchaeota archaeon]|nr:ATP-binding protein [Candidatus Geothermarchaeota archaeon]